MRATPGPAGRAHQGGAGRAVGVILSVPVDEPGQYWPTLGPQVADFIEQNLVFGPGDLRGQPAILDDEKRAFVYRLYEVFPMGHDQAGRRRFKRACLSLRKGTAKTEFAAWIAAVELHPEGPVRCVGWTPSGDPIGGGVSDPYIPMVAYTEEQSEELGYGALCVILRLSTLADDFDIGLERIERKRGGGKAVPLASAPDARDGARTTFQHFDETHRFTLPRLVNAHRVMLANVPKRPIADGWSLETTTAPEPGAGSVAESTMAYARSVADGRVKDSRLFYFHRQASESIDLSTNEGLLAAAREASGPTAAWSDLQGIVDIFQDPTSDRAYLQRVWFNQLTQSSSQAFDVLVWRTLAAPRTVEPGALIVFALDGSLFHDATAIVATEVATGYQWLAGLWERPIGLKPDDEWKVPDEEVDATVADLFERFTVWRFYADPPYWRDWIKQWTARYGDERVIEWWTNRRRQMAEALRAYVVAMKTGTLSHSGDKHLERHIANARREDLPVRDEQGQPLWIIRKERPDSPLKMDAAMAACLAWEARNDAIAANALEQSGPSVYETRGLTSVGVR